MGSAAAVVNATASAYLHAEQENIVINVGLTDLAFNRINIGFLAAIHS